jgi:hypothetical protein
MLTKGITITQAKTLELLGKLDAHQAKGAELLAELRALIEAEPTIGQNAKRILDYFVEHWKRKFPGEQYVVNGAKDMASLKRILKTLPVEEVAARVRSYFRQTERFIVEGKYSLPIFCASINKLTTGNPSTYVVGCIHTPRCGSEQEHTRKQLDEVRAGAR